MKILNLTPFPSTNAEKESGLIDISPQRLDAINQRLTFSSVPSHGKLKLKARALVSMVKQLDKEVTDVLIHAPNFFASTIEKEFAKEEITCHYRFHTYKHGIVDGDEDGFVTVNTFE